MRQRLYDLNQHIAWRLLGRSQLSVLDYLPSVNPTVAGEDASGDIVVYVGRDQWVPFTFWRPGHVKAVHRARLLGGLNYLDLT